MPAGIGFEQIVVFGDGDVVISLAVVGTGEIFANRRLVRSQMFRDVQFSYGFGELLLLCQQRAQAAVGLPKLRIQVQRLAEIFDGLSVRRQFLLGHAHFVIDVSILGIAGQRFLKCIQGGRILFIGVVPEPQHAIGFGVLEIHAEGGAGFGDGTVAVVTLIEDQSQAIVDFRKIGLGLFGAAVFIERGVPVALLLLNVSQSKVQGAVAGIVRQ